MTARKDDIKLDRTPEFVPRETGAAELEISPDTWDRWVKARTLPPAESGLPLGTVRWHWPKVARLPSRRTLWAINNLADAGFGR
jgi:hypothetical protein